MNSEEELIYWTDLYSIRYDESKLYIFPSARFSTISIYLSKQRILFACNHFWPIQLLIQLPSCATLADLHVVDKTVLCTEYGQR